MAQKRSRKANFHSFESRSENSPYARITRNMVNSPAWQELNPYEQTLYLHMKLKYNGKPGSENNISFTYKEGTMLMSKPVFTRSMDKLIEVGLVDLFRHMPYSKLSNIYGFSDRWHEYGTPDFKEKLRPKRHSKRKAESFSEVHI
jgi:hypothetical protein